MFAVALAVWGFSTGHPVVAALLAVAIEGHRLIKTRWELDNDLLVRIWTLCVVLFAVFGVVDLFRNGITRAGYVAVEWTTVALCPILLAQLYGHRDAIPASVLSLLARRAEKRARAASSEPPPTYPIDMAYAYICLCLVAAGTARPEGHVFYVGAVALTGWMALANPHRPRLRPLAWGACFLCVAWLGYVSHIGLHGLHVYLEEKVVGLDLSTGGLDKDKSITSIGTVGKLKLSSRIVWRVRLIEGGSPAYLREASFNFYRRGVWHNVGSRAFRPAIPARNDRWVLRRPTKAFPEARLGLRGKSAGMNTILALPTTALALGSLRADSVGKTGLGVVQISETPRILDFEVAYESGLHGDTPPGPRDTDLYTRDMKPLSRIAAAIGLSAEAPLDSMQKLSDHFAKNFTYSTYLEIPPELRDDAHGAVIRFLEEERRGHCEYFATATALLLRAAGIPARYVTGFAVVEYSARRREYLVRGLHGHAWTQVWTGSRWEALDTTPGGWEATDRGGLSWFQPVRDWLAELPFVFAGWRKSAAGQAVFSAFKWGAVPLLLVYLWWRLFKGRRARRAKAVTRPALDVAGSDSEWFPLEEALEACLGPRPPGTTPRGWWTTHRHQVPGSVTQAVDPVLDLHYRLRFSSDGLAPEERAGLTASADRARDTVAAWRRQS